VDISTWIAIEFLLSTNPNFSSPLFTLTLPSGIVVVSGPLGTFTGAVLAANSIKCALSTGPLVIHYWQSHRADPGARRLIGEGTIPIRA
jgi:hypothetical protein